MISEDRETLKCKSLNHSISLSAHAISEISHSDNSTFWTQSCDRCHQRYMHFFNMIEENAKLQEFLTNNPTVGDYFKSILEKKNQEKDQLTKQNQDLIETVANLSKTIDELKTEVGNLTSLIGQQKATPGNINKRKANGSNSQVAAKKSGIPHFFRQTNSVATPTIPMEQTSNDSTTQSTENTNTVHSTQTSNITNQHDGAKINSSTITQANNENQHNLNAANPSYRDNSDETEWTLVNNRREKENISPIQLSTMTPDQSKTLIAQLNRLVKAGEYKWMQKRQASPPKIFTVNSEIKNTIIGFLNDHEYEFNTFADETNKLKSFIIRGICCGSDEENITLIRHTIGSHGCQTGFELERFTTGFQKQNPKNINLLYRITVPSNFDEKFFANIRTVGVFGVRIEKMKNGNIVQCRNCQRFSHTARQCYFGYRCVKCVMEHEPGNCPRNTNQEIPVACINCHTAGLNHIGHSANQFADCLAFKQTKEGAKNPGANVNSENNNNSKQKQNKVNGANDYHGRNGASSSKQGKPNTSSFETKTTQRAKNPSTGNQSNQTGSWAKIVGNSNTDNTQLLSSMAKLMHELLPGLIKMGEVFAQYH